MEFKDLILCRPALPKDRAAIMEFLKYVWDGDDYVPELWDSWLFADPGMLAVAEMGGAVVGQGHLADLGDGEWWLEGLRVHPDNREQGIGSHLHDYFIERWLESDGDVVRLATHAHRISVQKMCERTGFERVSAFLPMECTPLFGDSEHGLSLADEPNWQSALEEIGETDYYGLLGGLMDYHWTFALPRAGRLSADQGDRLLKSADGWLHIVRVDPAERDRDAHLLATSAVGSSLESALLALRRWMGEAGLEELSWLAPKEPEYLEVAAKVGFARMDEEGLLIYERQA
ncbi:MAG: GNAT family N-acetyltransferase [Anaerolineales bacterium]